MKFRAKSALFYHYYGFIMGRLTVKVKVISMNVVDGHAAVWAGVSGTNNLSWVQGGIERSGPHPPMAYIETYKCGDTPRLQVFPFPAGETMTVHLKRVSWRHWKCIISWGTETHESAVTYIKGMQNIDAGLEIWGHASAVVTVNGKTVKGSAKQ
jgi:hypothetical protein